MRPKVMGPGPLARNPYNGKRYPLSWFMFRLSLSLGGRTVSLPFGRSTWRCWNVR